MIYLDNAATTIKKPDSVIQAVSHAMNELGNSGRGVHEGSLNSSRIIYDARQKLNEFFHGCNSKQIVFTNNATESLNIAIKGLLKEGDHAITTVMEHNSVLRPLYEMEKEGIHLTLLPTDVLGNIDYTTIENAIIPETKAIIITHGSNLTGNLVDIEKVGRIAQKHHILFIVDASQTAGVQPIDIKEMHIDVLCFTGHKSLLGPQGTGGMYIKEGLSLHPLKTGGSGIDTYSKEHPKSMPTALEAGTLNGHGIAGLAAAIDYLNRTDIETIRQQELALMWTFYEEVNKIANVKIYGDFLTENRCPIVTLNIGEEDSSVVSDALFVEYNIATRSGGHCAPLMHQALGTIDQGAVRFSFSHYNTMDEVNSAIDAIKQLSKTLGRDE